MMHEHDIQILMNPIKPSITLCKCAWCSENYYLELQQVEDMNFCTTKCRNEWNHYIDEYKVK